MYRVGVVFFLALAVALVLLRPPVSPPAYAVAAGAAFFVALAALSWRGLGTLRAVVVLYENGVVRRMPSGREQAARWDEVAAVRERPHRRQLELLDQGGARLVVLSYDLEGFARLQRVVLERTAPFRAAPARSEFAVSPDERWGDVAVVAILAFLAWVLVAQRQPTMAWLMGGLGAFFVGRWLWLPWRVRVEEDRLTLAAVLRRVEIALAQVVAVRVVEDRKRQLLRLERLDGPPLQVPRTAGGVVPLYDAVEAAWRRCRAGAGVAPDELVGAAEQELEQLRRNWPKLIFLLLIPAFFPAVAGWLHWRTLALHPDAVMAPRGRGWLGLGIFVAFLLVTMVLALRQRALAGRARLGNALLGWCALVVGAFLLGQVYRGSGDATWLVLWLPLVLAGLRLFTLPPSDDPELLQDRVGGRAGAAALVDSAATAEP